MGVKSSVVEGTTAVLERLAKDYGEGTEVARFVESWLLAPGKLIVSTMGKENSRYWVVAHNPRKGQALGYGREVKFGRDFDTLDKLLIGSATVEVGGLAYGGLVTHEAVRFYVVDARDVFATRVVL